MSTISAKVCMRLRESIKREQSCDSSNHRPQCRNSWNGFSINADAPLVSASASRFLLHSCRPLIRRHGGQKITVGTGGRGLKVQLIQRF